MFRLHVPDMACGGCVRSITKAIQDADATATVEADTAAREVRIRTGLGEPTLLAALQAAGFPAEPRPAAPG
jgi:copper chaperone